MTDKDHQATNNTTADQVNKAEVNGSVMKNRNSTTGVNITSVTVADVKKSPASLETGSGNTQSGADGEDQKGVQSQLNASIEVQSNFENRIRYGYGYPTKITVPSVFTGCNLIKN